MGLVKAWFVSDIHILDQEDPRLKRFEDFLRARLHDETTHLFLVGDIFDLWVGGDAFFSKRFNGVVELVQQLKIKGVEVVYFEGNHDLHLRKFWADELGCRVETEPKYFELGKTKVRVEHGDQMNPKDNGYLVLRSILRTSGVQALCERLPGSIIQSIGNSMSKSSRKWTSSSMKARNDDAIRAMIRTHAAKAYEQKPFDMIVSGHVHTRDDFSWRPSRESKDVGSDASAVGREVRSVNLGCWFSNEQPQAFLLEEDRGSWMPV